jgi:hypothetical protein
MEVADINIEELNLQLFLCFNWASCYDDVWGSGGRAPLHIISALHGGERSASRPDYFTLGERSPLSHCTVGWCAPQAVYTTWIGAKYCPNRKSKS